MYWVHTAQSRTGICMGEQRRCRGSDVNSLCAHHGSEQSGGFGLVPPYPNCAAGSGGTEGLSKATCQDAARRWPSLAGDAPRPPRARSCSAFACAAQRCNRTQVTAGALLIGDVRVLVKGTEMLSSPAAEKEPGG